MSTKVSLFAFLSLLAALVLTTACGAPSEQAADGDATEKHDEALHKTDGNNDDDPLELAAAELAAGEKLEVVATTNIIGDLAGSVGGDAIELTTLVPIGADPHTFDPVPQDVAAVADADVILINGLHLEEFLAELIENAGGEAPLVTLSANVETRELNEDEDEDEELEGSAHEEGDRHHEDHQHEGLIDPHVWLNPANAQIMVGNIEHALSQLDPANAELYQANAKAYQAELEELDAWVTAQIESIPAENRKIVTDHDALGYYADRYGLEVVGTVLPTFSTNAEPSAQALAKLQAAIGDLGVRAVFVGTTINPALAERVARDTGISLVPLYTGSLGEAGSGAESYLDYIRHNTRAIVEALQQPPIS